MNTITLRQDKIGEFFKYMLAGRTFATIFILALIIRVLANYIQIWMCMRSKSALGKSKF